MIKKNPKIKPMNKYSREKKIKTDKLITLPVHDGELELDTLACIVYNPKNYSKIMLLEADDFYITANREIFQGIRECYKKDKVINLPTLSLKLKKYSAFLKLINIKDYVITTQVNLNIKKLKGIKTSRRIQDLSYQATLKTSQGENPADVRNWLAREIEKITTPYDKEEITIEALEERFDKMLDESNTKPITTGFPKLDRKIGGLANGTMTIIAAAQGVGKSTMVINILNHICGKLDRSVLYVSLEMTFDNLYLWSISSLSGVPYQKMKYRKSELGDDELELITNARAKINQYRQVRMGEEEISVDDIRYKLKEKEIDVVIIDYLQRIKPNQRYASEYERLTNISGGLASLSKEFNIPIVVIASINRKYSERTDNTPRVSDIRGSGSIEFDADTVLLLHRDSAFGKYTKGDIDKYNHGGKLYIAKNRYGESNKVIEIYFDGARVLIREMEG